jgi:Tol biopolymer transport system component
LLSNTLGGNTGVATNGYLTVVKQDGTGYTVLDPDHPSSGRPAVSADGTWIAYGFGASGWLFGGELGPQEIKPLDYGLQSGGTLSAPAWSPDGSRLAWAWRDQAGMVSPLVLDMNKKSYLMAQTAVNEGSQIIGSLQWDPSGRWLVYAIQSANSTVNGIWMMDTSTPNGRAERITDQNLIPGVWSPDGTRLALASYIDTQPGAIWLLDLPAGKMQPVDTETLGPAPMLIGWQ